MKQLVLESWLLLFRFEIVMHLRDLRTLHRLVERQRVNSAVSPCGPSSEELCHAVDLACVFYFKPVLCLQRSAATTLLLRRHGWGAEMVIGAQILPFKSHAWVEMHGKVVNDKPYILDIYQVLERC
jgi:Transglutaminase-like superfamily